MSIVFNISQNKKKLKDLFDHRPPVHPSTRPPVNPSQLGLRPRRKGRALDPEGRTERGDKERYRNESPLNLNEESFVN